MSSFKPALFNKGKKIIQIKDQFTNNDTIVHVYSKEDKMVEQTGNSSLKPVKSDQLSELGFFGDEYAVNDMQQTVSISASIICRLCVLVLIFGADIYTDFFNIYQIIPHDSRLVVVFVYKHAAIACICTILQNIFSLNHT